MIADGLQKPNTPQEEVKRLTEALLLEVIKILGLPRTRGWCEACRLLFGRGLRNLAEIGLTFDRLLVERGLREASAWALTHWCHNLLAQGQENTPLQGPLLIISNHPGTYDALVLAAHLPRPDLHFIVSDLPFFRALKNFSRRAFFIPPNVKDAVGRMAGMLAAVRHLKSGRAVLLMGSGTIDPDPAVYPGARKNLQRWTEAANLFLRFVPETHVLLAIVSHVLHPKWAHHPLVHLWRNGLERRRVAEFFQVIQQLFHPGSLYVSPRVTFSPAWTASELGDSPRKALIQRATALLEAHCTLFGGYPA